ncbi:sensor histidine kinase [Nocardioides daejeonensis]|uniref:sensor histidine kinase n=1 Tax=Nocardioides daejeonensis TaxID=1046556 RepID=UPI000D74319A|nr:HAMP domain-containing sensor histidine kinase [Nocardioides daejeonensis]
MTRSASLTSRLVLTTITVAALVSVLIGVVTTLAVRAYLTDQLDDNVHASLQGARIFGVDTDGGPPRPGPVGGPGRDVASMTARWTGNGSGAAGWLTTQRATGRPDYEELSQDDLAALIELPTDGRLRTVDLGSAGTFRVAVERTRGGEAVVAVGIATSNVDEAVTNLVQWELLLSLLAIAGAGTVATLVVRRQLRPLREVAATAHTVAELPLASGAIEIPERVPDHLTDESTEVGQVGAALNNLLRHVESSLAARHRSEQQVRQFVADASHELRTPLATIQGYAELSRRAPDDRAMQLTALAKVEAEAMRMSALVEDLLLLARLDAGRPLQHGPVDVTRLLLESVSDARVLGPDHHWRLALPETALEAVGDEERLRQVVRNLLENARRHTPPGTTVVVDARSAPQPGAAVTVTITDDGPGFDPALLPVAFDRFTRGDPSRNRGGGSGLGLSLVQAILAAQGGAVALTSRPGETRFTLTLPTR